MTFLRWRAARVALAVLALLTSLVAALPAAAAPPPDTPDCTPQALVRLPGVRAPDPRLIAPAAASFAQVRATLIERSGQDVLAVLSDVLRAPAFRTDKPGVADRSWHKAGRAVDLNTGGPFTLRREGALFRVFVGAVDLTAIFEAQGWVRIPPQAGVLEWWHYEYHPDGIAWPSAMAQVWPRAVLMQAFPEIDWSAVGCAAGGGTPPGAGDAAPDVCIPDPPIWGDGPGVSYSRGCGPPVLPPGPDRASGTALRQFTQIVGWLGATGQLAASGPTLHLGLSLGSTTDLCRWPLQAPGVPAGELPPGGEACQTSWADPLQFLPQANPDTLALENGTPVPVTGAGGDAALGEVPLQLPPPGHPATTLLPPADPQHPDGSWWSPGNDDRANQRAGALGGPAIRDWLAWLWCLLFRWLPWSGCGP